MGGLGSWSSLLLAQLNVGFLRIVDRDVVELSNLPRTPIYNLESIDLPKVEEAKKFLSRLNDGIEIEAIATNIDEFTIKSLIKDLDIIIDGLDTFSTRYIVNKACYGSKIPFIFAGAISISSNLSTISYKENTACLNCFFGGIDDEDMPTCEIAGVHTSILSITASIQVAEAIKLIITGESSLESKIAYFDLNTYDFDIIDIKKNELCKVCGNTVISDENLEPKIRIIELCGNESYSLAPIPRKAINISEIMNKLKNNTEAKIKKSGELGLTFKLRNVEISIFRGGNILLRNVKTKSDAEMFFKSHLSDYFK